MRRFSLFLNLLIMLVASSALAKEVVTVTDLAGREVQLSVPVDHVILGEGRYLPAVAILDRDNPIKRITGMVGDFERYDPAGYAQFKAHFPKVDEIPRVGAGNAGSFSIEQALTVKPDVAIFGVMSGHGPGAKSKEVLDIFDKAGIPVVMIDFRIDPLVNTPKSLALLGRIFGKDQEAAEFLDFYREQLSVVQEGLAGIDRKPTVFLESRVGLRKECCEAMGDKMMGRFVAYAGGRNIFADRLPGTHGTVSLEHLLVNQPDIYMATAIGSPTRDGDAARFVTLGAGADAQLARDSLRHAVSRKGIAELDAVKQGRAYAVWHHFYNSPLNVAAVQAMAKWFHPELFKDLDPNETLRVLYDRFQPFPMDGTYWTGLDEGRAE